MCERARIQITRAACLVALLTAVAIAFSGCAGTMPKQTPLMQEVGGIVVTSGELHDLTYEYSKFWATVVELRADEIRASSDDPEVRYNALLWKSYAIPAMQRAAIQRDPFAALIDLSALNRQMRDYFESGAGKDIFGQWQPVAFQTCDELERTLLAIVRRAQPGRDSTRQDSILTAWVEANPIEGALFIRPSTRPLLSELTARRFTGGLGGVAQTNEIVAEISDRLEIYTEQMPRQIRWQAEIALEDAVGASNAHRFLGDVDSIDTSAKRIADFLDTIEGIIARERAIVLEEVDRSLAEALGTLQMERAAITEDLSRERQSLMADVSQLAEGSIDRTTTSLNEVVDRIFARLTLLLVGLVLSCLVAGAILIALSRALRGRPAAA